MVQQGHRGPYPNMSLAVVGENRQEKNGVGMEVQGLQIVMVKNGKEELGKRGHQTGGDGAHEELVEGASIVLRKGGATLSAAAPLLPCTAIIWRMRVRFLSDTFGGSRAGEYHAPTGV